MDCQSVLPDLWFRVVCKGEFDTGRTPTRQLGHAPWERIPLATNTEYQTPTHSLPLKPQTNLLQLVFQIRIRLLEVLKRTVVARLKLQHIT